MARMTGAMVMAKKRAKVARGMATVTKRAMAMAVRAMVMATKRMRTKAARGIMTVTKRARARAARGMATAMNSLTTTNNFTLTINSNYYTVVLLYSSNKILL
jgi:hypothetical protein